MKLDLRRITVAEGEAIPFAYDVDLSAEERGGEYPFPKPAHIVGEVRNHLGVLTLHAGITAQYETRCARCLAPVSKPIAAVCDAVLTREEPGEERDDLIFVEGDTIDLDDICIPALWLDVQMTYLCRPDCKGLCPTCGKNLNEGPCSCAGQAIDSRLAVLQKLLEHKGTAE